MRSNQATVEYLTTIARSEGPDIAGAVGNRTEEGIHAKWLMAHQHFGAETPEAVGLVAQQKQLLADSRLRQVLHNIWQLFPKAHGLPEVLSKAIAYLFHNRFRMRYKQFRDTGYPIGSGPVEAACKVVVQTCLKQAGMRWSRPGAQAVLALRSFLVGDRWHLAASSLALA